MWNQLGCSATPWRPSRRALLTCAGATALFFAAVQVWTPAADFYRWALGVLQWPARAVVAGQVVPVVPVQVWQDPLDLVALPAVGIAVAVGFIGFMFYPYSNFIWYKNPDIWAHLADSVVPFALIGLLSSRLLGH